MTVGEMIRARRKACKMTLEALGEAIGVSKQTIQRYESGVIANIPADKIEGMARALSTTPAALMGWSSVKKPILTRTKHSKGQVLRVLGRIACGVPIYADEQNEDTDSITLDDITPEADFCLIAKGDSMVGARIFDGDTVFIRRQESVDNGDIAAVIVEGEATLKRVYYYPHEQKLILSPENKDFQPLVYVGHELDQVKIIGKAVAFQSRIR